MGDIFLYFCFSSFAFNPKPERIIGGINMLSCPSFSSIHRVCVPEPGSPQLVPWCAHHLACLRYFNLAEPIPTRWLTLVVNTVGGGIIVHLRNISTLAGDLHRGGPLPSCIMLTPPPHVSLACQLKRFTRAWHHVRDLDD